MTLKGSNFTVYKAPSASMLFYHKQYCVTVSNDYSADVRDAIFGYGRWELLTNFILLSLLSISF